MNDHLSVYENIRRIAHDRNKLKDLMHKSYSSTRDWLWEKSALKYAELFTEIHVGT
jgi:hypothetical protein